MFSIRFWLVRFVVLEDKYKLFNDMISLSYIQNNIKLSFSSHENPSIEFFISGH